jgi:lipoprotein-releasing system permease protein
MVRISVLAIALGLAVMILAVAIVSGFKQEIRNKLIGFGAPIQITYYDSNISDEPQPINKSQLPEELKSNSNVKHVSCFATKNGIVKTKDDNEGVLLKGIGNDYDWSFIQQNLIAGKIFTVPNTEASKSIVISQTLAKRLQLNINDKMVIYFLTKKNTNGIIQYEQRAKTFFICGIYHTGYEDKDNKLVFVDIAQIQKLNYWNDNQIGGYELSVNDFSKIDQTNDEINNSIGQELIAQTILELNPTIFSWLDLQNINALIVIVLMIIVAGINIITSLLILILERTNMIGLLKAMGASSRMVQKIFIINSFYLLLNGMFWGNLIGLTIAFLQRKFHLIKLDQQSYYISSIPIHLHWNDVLLLNIGTLVCCLCMIVIPSFIVTRITPLKAIRFN